MPFTPDANPVDFALADPRELGTVVGGAVRLLASTSASGVRIDDHALIATLGPWRLRTPIANIADAEVTGPYRTWKVAGARLSLADRGLTFGTTTRAGVCISFRAPVPGIEPIGLLRHPSLTVTVAEPELLVAHLWTLLRGA